MEVRSCETRLDMILQRDPEALADLLCDPGCRGRGEGEDALNLQLAGHRREFEVIGAEIVPPFRNAMGLVDGEQGNATGPQVAQESLVRESLGRNVEDLQGAVPHALVDGLDLSPLQSRVKPGGGDPLAMERLDLVFHQSDEWRDHEGEVLEE